MTDSKPESIITSVESRDAREMIASEGVELYLDLAYDSGRQVSLPLSNAAVEDLKEELKRWSA